MPIKTEMWRIDKGLEKVIYSSLEAEKKLQSILEEDISIIDPDLMTIGRQVLTSPGNHRIEKGQDTSRCYCSDS
jgi:hypothetical protein